MIYIGYSNEKWRKVCTTPSAAYKILKSPDLFNVLVDRLEHISAFENLAQIPPGGKKDWHSLTGDRKGQWSITIEKPYVICMRPAGDFESDPNSGIKLNTVTAVEVVFVGDYHPRGRRKNVR